MKLAATLLLIATLHSANAEIVALWSYHKAEQEAYRFYIDSERLKTLKDVDLLNEIPEIDLSTAAKIAISHMEQVHSKLKFRYSEVIFGSRQVGGKSIGLYTVRTQPIPPAEDSKVAPGPWEVEVAMDGAILKSMPDKDFQKKFPKAKRRKILGMP